MSSDFMKYEESVLTDLSSALSKFAADLSSEASDFHTAANSLATAWEGNAGLDAFQRAVAKWDKEFGLNTDSSKDTAIGLLNALSVAVSDALNNAQAADRGVQNSFSQYE